MSAEHERVASLIAQKRNDEATKLILDLLNHDQEDVTALFQLSVLMLKEDRKGLAYNLLARACKLSPKQPELWLNFARAHKDSPAAWGKSEWCLKKALTLYNEQGKSAASAWANLAMLHYIRGNMDKAQRDVNKALEAEPDHSNSLVTQGFIHLAKGEWDKAWHLYDIMVETGKRENYSYGDEPVWNGDPGKRVIVSGEQGLGDEIMYASCFNELIEDSSAVVIECMPILKDLFQRSFPKAKVYGTRWNKEVFWDEDHNPQAHVAMASLPRYYRHKDSDFPGKPYLKPNMEMARSFEGLLQQFGDKPRIGIAWTGGTDRTRGYLRTRRLEELVSLVRQDATWISLEYHDRSKEIAALKESRGIEINAFPWINGFDLNYDLAAALISTLDLVIAVPTTVVQTAGALGIETWVMVPKYTGWIFARDCYPWAESVTPIKNPSAKDMAQRLEKWLSTRTQISSLRLATG